MKKQKELIDCHAECDYLDFKEENYHKDNKTELVKDLIALANSHSTRNKYIIIGIKEENNICEEILEIDNEYARDEAKFQQIIKTYIKEDLMVEYKIINIEGKDLLIIKIPATNNSNRPFMVKTQIKYLKENEIYIRKGSSTALVNKRDLEYMFKEKINANGGIIYIGKDDKGKVVGINNAVKLVKEIPNKIKDTMGIIPEVKVEEENDLLYLVIKVDSYPMPISCQGKFYLRSGSNNHEVTGSELDKFMLDRVGKRWEDLPVKNATLEDLSEEAFKVFKEKAVKSGRLKVEDVEIDNETLLKNLGLYDGNYLNKAAILLFGKDPNKWIVGSYIKIGFFEENDADLRYQDEIQGALILQIDKSIDLIYLKYLKALIHYEGVQRIEEYMFPRERI